MRFSLVLVALAATAFADPAPRSRCGAPCREATKFLGGTQWDYRKAAAIYKRECKPDFSGPADACRLYALAGWETRGVKLKEAEVLAILGAACTRGDAPACAWKTWLGTKPRPAPKAFASLEAPCRAGDRASCAPLFHSMDHGLKKQCERAWWGLAETTCKAGISEGCIFLSRMFVRGQHSCDATATKLKVEDAKAAVAKLCDAGDPDACLDLRPNDQILWERRCKAGEQFACDAFR